MYTGISIKNYRCFVDVEVPLRPLTVLIGQNDTGKSAFLQALKMAAQPHNIDVFDVWKLNQDQPDVVIKAINMDKVVSLVEYNTSNKKPKFTNNIPASHTGQTISVIDFDLPSSGPLMVSPGIPDSSSAPPPLKSNGENVPALVDFLLRRSRRRFFEFVETARSHIPGLQDVNIGTPQPANRQLELALDSDIVIPADRASVGVRVILFFLSLSFHPDPPDLILVEEPERGVHPKRLADILALFRSLTSRSENPIQIVLSTHSPYLLDSVDPALDEVLIFRKEEDGSRTVHPANEDRLAIFLDEFNLGEVWFNEGEEKMVGSS